MEDLVARTREHKKSLAALRATQQELSQRLEAEDRNLAGNISAIREAENRLARTFALNVLPAKPKPKPKPEAPRGVEEARGGLSPPVEGEVVGRAGPGGRGVVLKTKPGAPVRNPWDGKVAYAGPAFGLRPGGGHGPWAEGAYRHGPAGLAFGGGRAGAKGRGNGGQGRFPRAPLSGGAKEHQAPKPPALAAPGPLTISLAGYRLIGSESLSFSLLFRGEGGPGLGTCYKPVAKPLDWAPNPGGE